MKIAAKIIFALLVTTSTTVGTYAIVESNRTADEYLKDAQVKYSTSLSSILPGLSKAVWNIDKELAMANMAALFQWGEVQRLSVFDDKNRSFISIVPTD